MDEALKLYDEVLKIDNKFINAWYLKASIEQD